MEIVSDEVKNRFELSSISDYNGVKFEVYFKFSFSIDEVWALLKDLPKFFNENCTDLFSNLKIESQSKRESGCIFSIEYKTMPSYAQILEVNGDNIHRKSVTYFSFINNLHSLTTISLFYDTLEEKTILIKSVKFKDGTDITNEMLNIFKEDSFKLFRCKNKLLATLTKKDNQQTESCLIKTNVDNLWGTIKNLKKLVEIAPDINLELSDPDKELKLYTKVELKSNSIPISLFVVKLEDGSNGGETYTLSLHTITNIEAIKKDIKDITIDKELSLEYRVPNQEIIFEVTKITKDLSLLTYRHNFFDNYINKKELNKFKVIKVRSLEQIQKYFDDNI